MSNYFEDDEIDDVALAAVLGESIAPGTSSVRLPDPTNSAPKRKQETKTFNYEDDFDDEVLAAVLRNENQTNWDESIMNPGSLNYNISASLLNHRKDNFRANRGLPVFKKGQAVSNGSQSAKQSASVRIHPSQQTRIGHYFKPSPLDPESIKSSILEFNTGARIPLISDIEIAGTLIYPVNLPKRHYQVDCVESAVRENTLVVLPTGLGKTFVASVMFYNMLRWFPTGKCVFMAPTRQLVIQQAKACCEMCPIPQDSISIMLGIHPNSRSSIWSQSRLIFCTPQIVEKDIQNGRCPLEEIICFVFDEVKKSYSVRISNNHFQAHHSVGNSAMAGIVAKRFEIDNRFRVLALSATPGSDRTQVQTVIDNLFIKRIVSYNRDDPAIVKYVNYRQEEIIGIKQTEEIRNLLTVLDDLCKKPAKILENQGLLVLNFTMLSPKYFQGDAFMSRLREKRLQENWAILNSRLILQGLLAARQYLCNYSVSAFVSQMEHAFLNSSNKALVHVSKDAAFTAVIQIAKDYVARRVLHPKLLNLRDLIKMHFETCPSSRVIIFVEYKMIVDEIVNCITDLRGALPIRFVGQQKSTGAGDTVGMRPKEQSEAIEKFRSGKANVLVATCIGEEGLDIGEVDLVIAYDTTSSALRTIQRMGRTARQRTGRCVSLIMEGNEMRSYESNLKNIENSFRLLRSNSIKLSTVQCCIRPSNLHLTFKFEHCSDIAPWKSPLPKKRAKGFELLSQERNNLEQLWSLNETELNGIQSHLMTSAHQVQEPLYRLVRKSEVSAVFTDIMQLITKVKLGHIDVESGNISLSPSASLCNLHPKPTACPSTLPQNQSPAQSSWLLPDVSYSDDELKELLEDIELLSQPDRSNPSSSPTFKRASFRCQNENLPKENEAVEVENSFKIPSKRPLLQAPAKNATQKKSKVGVTGGQGLSGCLLGLSSSTTKDIDSSINVQQFFWQTSLATEDRRDYLFFRLGCQKPLCLSSTMIRFRAPSTSSSSLSSLVLPVSRQKCRNRLV